MSTNHLKSRALQDSEGPSVAVEYENSLEDTKLMEHRFPEDASGQLVIYS